MRPARRDPKEEQEEGIGGEAQEHHQAKLDHRLVHQALVEGQELVEGQALVEGQEHHQAKLDHQLVHQALVEGQLGQRKGEETAKELPR